MSPEQHTVNTVDIELWMGLAFLFATGITGQGWVVAGTAILWIDAWNGGKGANKIATSFLPKDKGR